MNKHLNFWLNRWQQNDIPFHQLQPDSDLSQYWPRLKLAPGSTVLVPLCGKSLDMVWLQQQGHYIIGIEISQLAVEQFFATTNESYVIKKHDDISIFKSINYEIWVGDIFLIDKKLINPVDALYDRGSLIALPERVRKKYVPFISHWLKENGKILLKTANYNQEEMQGPPYSVPENEIRELYKNYSSIEQVKSNKRSPENMQHYIARGCSAFTDETWIITK